MGVAQRLDRTGLDDYDGELFPTPAARMLSIVRSALRSRHVFAWRRVALEFGSSIDMKERQRRQQGGTHSAVTILQVDL